MACILQNEIFTMKLSGFADIGPIESFESFSIFIHDVEKYT